MRRPRTVRGTDRDIEEFTQFVAARADQLYRSAYLLTTTPHGAEDLGLTEAAVQNRSLRALRSLRRRRSAGRDGLHRHRRHDRRGQHGTADPGYADDPTPTVAPSTPSSDPRQDVQDDGAQGWWDTPSRRMLAVLRTVLPDGVAVTEAERFLEGTTERTMAVGSLHGVLTGPTGPGAFQVILYPPDPGTAASEGSGPGVPGEEATQFAEGAPLGERLRCQPSMDVCEPLLDAAGATIGRASTNEASGTTYHEVMLLGPTVAPSTSTSATRAARSRATRHPAPRHRR